MEYKVITSGAMGPSPEAAAAQLAARVNLAMQEGWRPVGGVTLGPPDDVSSTPYVCLMQAMMKD